MAKVELNPLLLSLNGRIGGFVFYSYNGSTYCRTYVRPTNPNTRGQQHSRTLFANAMKAWQGLSSFDKESFRRRARRRGITGHNMFISRYMKSPSGRHAGPATETAGPYRAKRAASPRLQHAGHSVRASIPTINAHNIEYGPVPCRRAGPGPFSRTGSFQMHVQARR